MYQSEKNVPQARLIENYDSSVIVYSKLRNVKFSLKHEEYRELERGITTTYFTFQSSLLDTPKCSVMCCSGQIFIYLVKPSTIFLCKF